MSMLTNLAYLEPTKMIDSDHPVVIQYAKNIVKEGYRDEVGAAIQLYKAVRDDFVYNPYVAFHREESYQASHVIKQGKGYCVSKASLLCALGRVLGIPSRIGFATVRNHIATKQLIKLMGTDEFIYHGYTEFFLNGKWVSATPAFDSKTCKRHGVAPLDFNGIDDSKFQALNNEKGLFLEYLKILAATQTYRWQK